jgi:hypothetical protein
MRMQTMYKISSLFLGSVLMALPYMGYAAEIPDLLETTVENWAKKKLPLGSHFEKVIFNPQDISDDLQGATIKLREDHKKISFDAIQECFKNDQIRFEIIYTGESKITQSYSEELAQTSSFSNNTSDSQKYKVTSPELWDQFYWTLSHPLTTLALEGKFNLATTKSSNSIVAVKLIDSRTFQGKGIKNSSWSVETNIPPHTKLTEKGRVTKTHIQQPFVLKTAMDIHFAILYKSFKKKQKIDIYSLSSVFSPKHKGEVQNFAPTFQIPGTFKGFYITKLKYECTSKNLSTGEKNISLEKTQTY